MLNNIKHTKISRKIFGSFKNYIYICNVKLKKQYQQLKNIIRNMKKYITDDYVNYVKAFISVAEILEPQVNFNDVNVNWHKIEGCVERVERKVTVSGRLGNELIIVSTELYTGKGLQIVSTHHNIHTMEILSKKNVWYFSFNWKGLMNISNATISELTDVK